MATYTDAVSEDNWIQQVNESLRIPHNKRAERVIDLFAGCGGLALGFEAVGFRTHGFEAKSDCVQTYRLNLAGECI
jgi:DNA (cytosine-5)-methyltransferase 1